MILRSLESEWSHLLPRVCHACGHSIPAGNHLQGACRRTVIAICAGVPRTCEGKKAGSSGAKGRDDRQRVVGGLSGWMKKCPRGAMRCLPRRVRGSPWLPGMGRGDCLLRSKELLFQRCVVRVPLAQRSSGTRTRSRPVHSVVSRETSLKRPEEGCAESRAEAWVEEHAIEAGVEEPAVKAGIEEHAIEAGVEEPVVEAGLEEHASGAGHEPGTEAGHDHARPSPSHALGVNLAGCPQHYQEGQGPHPGGQEPSNHPRPPLVQITDGASLTGMHHRNWFRSF